MNIVKSWKIVARPASHDRGVLVVGAGRYHGVHALASTVAPDRGPRPKVDAVGNAGGDEDRPLGDDERDTEQDAQPEQDRVLLG